MPNLSLDRKVRETILLASISLFAVYMVRFPIESRLLLLAELVCLVGGFLGMILGRKYQNARLFGASAACLLLTPIATSVIGRAMESAIAFEMTLLTLFGAVSLALVFFNRRAQAMALVLSGFLALFATVISDHPYAVSVAIIWISVCVWHLVANHWDRIDLCSVDEVTRSGSVRPLTVALAIVLFIVGGLVAKDRFGDSDRFQFGFMPTSGGSEWSDPGATSGIGSGEAAIAAKDHAESFGAVDSEIFLETTGSTLFDMFSDSLGQPKVKAKWERRQGMTSENVQEAHSRTARSDKGSNSFSTERVPPKKHRHLKDVAKNALVQWSGPTGIRLAMERFDTFDGVGWKNNARLRNERFLRYEAGKQVWFMDPKSAKKTIQSKPTDLSQGMLKIIRLHSVRLPVPMMTSGLHIKDIDREDFFGLHDDGSFFMPGRDRVPPLTVIHVVSRRIMEDELIRQVNDRPSANRQGGSTEKIKALVASWTSSHTTKYAKLRSIIDHLRQEFVFDRQAEMEGRHLAAFLETRRGGDHLFATTAALMAREIGLRSRLVTGLYVRPSATDIAAGHSNVLPHDVHAWVEIELGDGRWFEIEPTPTFQEPTYTPSLWLTTKRFAAAHWPKAIFFFTVVGFVYFTRLIWAELMLLVLWWASSIVRPRRRLALAVRIIELRATLLGHSRPAGSPTRDWLLNDVAAQNESGQVKGLVESFCDLADRLCFGQNDAIDRADIQVVSGVVDALPMRVLKKSLLENHS